MPPLYAMPEYLFESNKFYHSLFLLIIMVNKEQLRKQVIQYFKAVGSGENISQCIKQALFLHDSFNPVCLFNVITHGRQKMTPNDVRNYLLKHNIIFNEDELRYYLNHNKFKHEVTLNEFLQAMIPYNADVVRLFKQKYLDALEIKELHEEVDFISSELLDNDFKLIRNLINIREGITNIATKKQIETLIKEDLILESKTREGRKFYESFQKKDFVLGFHELRKFLELWLSEKEMVHEFNMLNVMRHLQSDHPFQKIIMKSKRSKSAKGFASEAKKKIESAKKMQKVNLTNEKLRQNVTIDLDTKYESSGKADKYNNFKRGLLDQFTNTHVYGQRDPKEQKLRNRPQERKEGNERDQQQNQLRRSRQKRQNLGYNGGYLIKMIEEIVIKEERLEKLRKNMAKSADFNLINLFKLFDQRNKGYVSNKDLGDFTKLDQTDFRPLVNFYARQFDRLRFHEFCLIFRPLSKQLNETIQNRPEHKLPNPFKKQTNKLILQVLALTAQMHSNISHIKQKMISEGINPQELFRFADLDQRGFLNADCIKQMLSENNIFCDDKDLKCVMKLFRKKVDEEINLADFMNFLDL